MIPLQYRSMDASEGKRNVPLSIAVVVMFLYFSQKMLHLPDILAQGMLGFMILWGGYAMVETFFSVRRPVFITVGALFLFLLVMLWGVSDMDVHSHSLGKISTSVMLKNGMLVFLSLFIGFQCGRKNGFPSSQQREVAVCVTITSVLQYFIVLRDGMASGNYGSVFVNNAAYCFVTLIPFLFLISTRYPRLGVSLFSIDLLFLLACDKRGAILCFLIGMVVMTRWWLSGRTRRKRGLMSVIVGSAAVAAIAVSFFFSPDSDLRLRMMQTMEGYSSGRDMIYGRLIDIFMSETDDTVVFLGRGMSQTINITGNYAHSDWLELLSDAGLIGVAVYAMFFISYLCFIRRVKTENIHFIHTMNLIMLLLFSQSIFSMGYFAIFNSFGMLLLGLLTGMVTRPPAR